MDKDLKENKKTEENTEKEKYIPNFKKKMIIRDEKGNIRKERKIK